jgi:hypothetical protein
MKATRLLDRANRAARGVVGWARSVKLSLRRGTLTRFPREEVSPRA